MTKYYSRSIRIDGYAFDSLAEARRYRELLMLQRVGAIRLLVVHPRYELLDEFIYQGKKIRGIFYEGDFSYIENDEKVVEDVKGFQTKDFLIKAKLFKNKFPDMSLRLIDV